MNRNRDLVNDPGVLLIAGGTGSIGREIAAQALTAGWQVVVQGRTEASLAKLRAAQNPSHGERLQCVVADIRQTGEVEAMVGKAARCFGGLDAVIDCLVTGPSTGRVTGPFAHTSTEAYLPLAELSIVYLERLARAALPWLTLRGGTFVTLVSDAALFAAPNQTLIAAMRAAGVGFVKNLAAEVACDRVRAHCISLSYVEQTATAEKLAMAGSARLEKARQRAGLGLPSPADIAPLALFLCSPEAARITGQVVSINGGLNI